MHRMNGIDRHGLLALVAIVVVCISFPSGASATVVQDLPVHVTQPDGNVLLLRISGTMQVKYLSDDNGYTVIKDPVSHWYVYADKLDGLLVPTPLVVGASDPVSSALSPGLRDSPERVAGLVDLEAPTGRPRLPAAPSSLPAPKTGTLNNLVIFIHFADETGFGDPTSIYEDLFNNTATMSVKAYFQAVSYGDLTISSSFFPESSGDQIASWQDSHPRGYYYRYDAITNPLGWTTVSIGDARVRTLLRTALTTIAPTVPPDLAVDGDGDGYVDSIVFICSGDSDPEWSAPMWPHMSGLSGVVINGKQSASYNLQFQSWMTWGVLCHEMSHTLGNPDLYHYNMDGFTPAGVWDLMEANSSQLTARLRNRYTGWIPAIPTASASGTYTLNPLSSATNNALQIPLPGTSSEFLIAEFRRKTDPFESNLPGSGLLVYRVNSAYWGNAGGPPDELYVFRPGGSPTENGNVWNAWLATEASRTSLAEWTDPYPFRTSGAAAGVRVYDVGSGAGDTITFKVCLSIPSCDGVHCGDDGCGGTCGCDDGNSCTTDSCEGGLCTHAVLPDGDACDPDGDSCTNDVCRSGECRHETKTDGEACDADPYLCTNDTCQGGACVHAAKPDCTPCDASNACGGGRCGGLRADVTEGFEAGVVPTEWVAATSPNAYPWLVVNDSARSGTFSLATTLNNAYQESKVDRTVSSTDGMSVTFWHKEWLTASVGEYPSELVFLVDGIRVAGWKGRQDWASYTAMIPPGTHVLRWHYTRQGGWKDSDRVWLDDVVITNLAPLGNCGTPPECVSTVFNGTACLSCDLPDGSSCDEGNPCTMPDTCQDGACQRGCAPDGYALAADGNECTADQCQACSPYSPVIDGQACTADTHACTADVCSAGVCAHPSQPDCTSCGNGLYCADGLCGGHGSDLSVDFESGALPNGWTVTGEPVWSVGPTGHTGAFGAMSPTLTSGQEARLSYTLAVGEPSELSFWFRSTGDDLLWLLVDGGGGGYRSTTWAHRSANLSPGVHTIEWVHELSWGLEQTSGPILLDDIVINGVDRSACDDTNPCTGDFPGASGCLHCTLADGSSCDEGNPCTVPDTCLAGECQRQCSADGTAVGSDGWRCTTDVCRSCLPYPIPADCDDHLACTADRCEDARVFATDGSAFQDISSTGADTGVTGDGACYGFYPIGFSFPFFDGTSRTSYVLTENGEMHFDGWCESSAPQPCLPTDSYEGGVIAAYWDDLECLSSDSCTVKRQTFGSTPGRYTIVQWTNARLNGNAGSRITAQIVLFENGRVELRYRDLVGADGSSATIGMGAGPSRSVNYSCNTASVTPGTSLAFHQDVHDCLHDLLSGWCVIEGACVAEGTVHPENPCLECIPADSTTQWTSDASNPCSDDNLCTRADTCQDGVCTGADPVVCTASDQCHLVGTCTTSTGVCTDPAKPEGSTCNDADACTADDRCDGLGFCAGTNVPVDCAGSWSEWSACDVECGGGTQSRTFTVTTPVSCGGTACPDPLTESQACNPQPCPIDCEVSAWSDWSICSNLDDTCTGTQIRTRTVTVEPQYGGTACPALDDGRECFLTTGEPCNDADACTVDDQCDGLGVCAGTNVPVDCAGTWSEWSACDVGCGGGTQSRIFTVTTQASCGGSACPDPLTESQSCNAQPCPIDCEVSAWSEWSACSTLDDTCTGTQNRTRTVTVDPQYGGAACPVLDETRDCLLSLGDRCDDGDACTADDQCDDLGFCAGTNVPVDCAGSWSEWSACSVECGGGTQSRVFTVTTPVSCGGTACPDPLTESQDCNTQPCPIDCEVSAWSDWSVCSNLDDTCNGTQTRTRTVTVEPHYGGAACPALDDGRECFLTTGEPCNDADACTVDDQCDGLGICAGTNVPVDCAGTWSEWSTCSVVCGGGTQSRTFTVTTQASCGGTACPDPLTESQACNTQPCPIDCEVSAWSEWSVCSTLDDTCNGTQTRPRTVTVDPQYGGAACPVLEETRECLLTLGDRCDDADACTADDQCDGLGFCAGTNVPVDCAGSWSEWSACSVECGGGTQSRTFTVTTPASCGGSACPDPLTESQACNAQPCPIDCEVSAWSDWSICSNSDDTCTGTQIRTRTVTVDPQYGGAACPALDDGRECFLTLGEPCNDADACTVDDQCDGLGFCGGTNVPVDCAGSWSEWSACDVGCGGGTQSRVFTVTTPASCGGTACPDPLTESQDCNTQPCPIDCEVSAWSDWSVCSNLGDTCTGTQTRTRTVMVEPQYGGAACPALDDGRECFLTLGEPCNDADACTADDQCDGQGICATTPVSCDDSDDCTADGCDSGSGCTHELIAACCSDVHACPDFQGCFAGTCAPLMCRPCAIDTDCGTNEAKCVSVGLGTYCLPKCPTEDCPPESGCVTAPGDEAVCLPDPGYCECVRPDKLEICKDDRWLLLDECGAVSDSEFCTRGCVDDVGCCEEGTHAEGDVCAENPGEPTPDNGSDVSNPIPDEAETKLDVIDDLRNDSAQVSEAVEPVPDTLIDIAGESDADSGGTDGSDGSGCSTSSGRNSSGSIFTLLALLMVALLTHRRRQHN